MSTGDQPPPPEAGGEVKLEALSVSPMPVGLAPPSAAGGGGEPPQPAVSSSNKGGDDDDDSDKGDEDVPMTFPQRVSFPR